MGPDQAAGATGPTPPVTTLRGAQVEVDARRVGRVVAAVVWSGVLAVAAVLTVAGIHRNGQISQLRSEGVALRARVTGCNGLIGGSGSNAAGYDCSVGFRLDGRTWDEGLPGTLYRRTGSVVAVLVVPSRPSLVEAASAVRAEHPGDGVFVVPAVLVALDLLGAAVWALRRAARAGQRPGRGGV